MRVEPADAVRLRRADFVDLGAIVRLIDDAIERGCSSHYGPEQRRAVFLSYAQRLFVESLEPFETIVAEAAGVLVGVAQIDVADRRLRALFVAGDAQGAGLGRALLTEAERVARRRGCPLLQGAMSLSAVGFYEAAGYEPAGGREILSHGGVDVPVRPMRKLLEPTRAYV
jgi:putative acetyltransferase